MGGKSRKTGRVSKELIDRLKAMKLQRESGPVAKPARKPQQSSDNAKPLF